MLDFLALNLCASASPAAQGHRVPTVLDPAAVLSYESQEAASEELTVAFWTSNAVRYGSASLDGGRTWGSAFGVPNPGAYRVVVDASRIYVL